MKIFRRRAVKKILALIICLLLILSLLIGSLSMIFGGAYADSEKDEKITLLFTHDMHSHLEGFPKIKTIFEEALAGNKKTYLVDAGDFSMGTPFQTIFTTDASELRLMGRVGFDVTTFGNHEFDYRSKGLSKMLNSAISSGDRLSAIAASNIDWEDTLGREDLKDDGEKLKDAMEKAGVRPYVIIEKDGFRSAFFGIFGKQSDDYSPESGTMFREQIEAADDMVKTIKKEASPDLIVCLSHSGTAVNGAYSEDEVLAESVPDIDVIVSGHTHTYLHEPIKVGNTLVVSCGKFNESLGKLTLAKSDDGFDVDEYELIPLGDNIKADSGIAAEIDKFKEIVDSKYFSGYGLNWDQVLVKSDFEFTDMDSFGFAQGEETLGNLVSDAYIYGTAMAEGDAYEHIALAVAPMGVIRDSFKKGDITCADAFNVLSLGTGKDQRAGYPLVSVYLTGEELKVAPEIDISVSDMMPEARLYMSGIRYKYNLSRMILNKAYDIEFDYSNHEVLAKAAPDVFENFKGDEKIEDEKLYRVVANLYSAQMLSLVNSMSKGLLSVVPKDRNGTPIENFEDHIIYDSEGNELKEWYALSSYIDAFPDDRLPEYYSAPVSRKVEVSDSSLSGWFRKPNKYFWIIIGIAAALILAIISLIVIIVKIIKKIIGKRRPI